MSDTDTFQAWTVFANGEAHALYVGKHGLVYHCGDVLYAGLVSEIPAVPALDLRFCPSCVRGAEFRTQREEARKVLSALFEDSRPLVPER